MVLATVCVFVLGAVSEAGQDDKAKADDKQAEAIRKQFPILQQEGVPPLVRISDAAVSRTFPAHEFYVLLFRQYPVARLPPAPLQSQNVFAVSKAGAVRHVKDIKGLEAMFAKEAGPVMDEKAASASVAAWLRLTQELKQDGFLKFSVPKDSLMAMKSDAGWAASGKAVVSDGGKGEIRVETVFSEAGKLTKVVETSNIRAGIRPICQATRLLDADPVVRRMAEKDILVMGQSAKDYLDEQRAKATPELRRAIDQIWQRIVAEGW
jgi:hypothetical protein